MRYGPSPAPAPSIWCRPRRCGGVSFRRGRRPTAIANGTRTGAPDTGVIGHSATTSATPRVGARATPQAGPVGSEGTPVTGPRPPCCWCCWPPRGRPSSRWVAAHPPRRDRHGPGALRGRQDLLHRVADGQYYLGDAAYRSGGAADPAAAARARRGPPHRAAVRVGHRPAAGPPLAAPETMFVHKASFVLWFGAMAIHVLGHVLETSRLAPADLVARTRSPGPRRRRTPVGPGGVPGGRHPPRRRHGADRRPLARRRWRRGVSRTVGHNGGR